MRAHGTQSVRRLAERTGLANSRVHRPLQAIDRRDRYPESSWWETAAGRTWLIRLVVAALCVCGLPRGVGAATRSEVFGCLHLESHVGCAPSALRRVLPTLERRLRETAAAWEQEGVAPGEIRPVIGAVDATFWQQMMRVCMDLARGDVWMEEVAVERRDAPWDGGIHGRLKTVGGGVLSLVRDRATALGKLAHTGLGCLRSPDVLPLSHDLAKGSALTIVGRLRPATHTLAHATQRLETLQACPPASAQAPAQAAGEACAPSGHPWQGVRSAARERLAHGSRILPP